MTKQSTAKTEATVANKTIDETSTVANQAADKTLDTANAATLAGNEAAERTLAVALDAGAQVASVTENTQKALGETVEKFSVRIEGLSAFGQQNIEAFSKASEISAKAFEDFRGEVAAYTKTAHEDCIAAAQDFSSVKSTSELMEKQMSFAQHMLNGWAQQVIRVSEICTSATKEAAAPLGARVSAMTEELRSTARQ